MPHLVPGSEPSMLTCEFGYDSVVPLGGDILSLGNSPDLESQVGRLQDAIGRLCTSDDPGIQNMRSAMDNRYVEDMHGAPDGTPFACRPGESILNRLATCSDLELMMFAMANCMRQERVRAALIDNLPAIQDDVLQRVDRLHANGLISLQGRDFYAQAIEDVVAGERIYALDSFEAVLGLASTTSRGLHFSKLFKGGYYIGGPKPGLFPIAYHEAGHDFQLKQKLRVEGNILVVDELLVEHHSVVSEPGASPSTTVYEAAAFGSYIVLRKLLGLALMGAQTAPPEMLGEALTTPARGEAYTGLVRILRNNFNDLFPEYEGEAFAAFLRERNERLLMQQTKAVTRRWADLTKQRVMGFASN